MENAGAGAARILREPSWDLGRGILCVCGPGANGGDAMVVARHLAIESVPVILFRLARQRGETVAGDAGVQWGVCRAMGIPAIEIAGNEGLAELARNLADSPAVVDGLFGTGLDRPLEGIPAEIVARVNAAGGPVLALDVPSGLDCDSGRPLGACVRASVTATFAAPKIGFADPESAAWTGEVRVVRIGTPVDVPAG